MATICRSLDKVLSILVISLTSNKCLDLSFVMHQALEAYISN